jgi:hypothetical protein
MNIIYLAPVFMVFEMAQLLVAQRYIGLVQIKRGAHPLDGPPPMPWWLIACWLACLMADYAYQATLAFQPDYIYQTTQVHQQGLIRLAGLLMLLCGVVGFTLRRFCGLRWGLVVMTLEGSARAGFFLYVYLAGVFNFGFGWRHY